MHAWSVISLSTALCLVSARLVYMAYRFTLARRAHEAEIQAVLELLEGMTQFTESIYEVTSALGLPYTKTSRYQIAQAVAETRKVIASRQTAPQTGVFVTTASNWPYSAEGKVQP